MIANATIVASGGGSTGSSNNTSLSYVYESDKLGVIQWFQYGGWPTALLYVDDSGALQCYGPSGTCSYPNTAIQAANARGKTTHLYTSRVYSRTWNSNNSQFCVLLDTHEWLCHEDNSVNNYKLLTNSEWVYNLSPPMDESVTYAYGTDGKIEWYGAQIREPYNSTWWAVQVFNWLVLTSTGRIEEWNIGNKAAILPSASFYAGLPDMKQISRSTFDLNFNMRSAFCWISVDNTPYCWDQDTSSLYPNPSEISGMHFTKISTGAGFMCAIKTDTTVYCWYSNGVPLTILPPIGLTGVVEVSAGLDTICARTNLGKIACWGGDANFSENQNTYIPVNLRWGN